MSRGAQSFKQGDVTKAIKGVVNAGFKIGRVEIGGGKIIVFAGGPEENETGRESHANEWDTVK
jgi:hypothetical protein